MCTHVCTWQELALHTLYMSDEEGGGRHRAKIAKKLCNTKRRGRESLRGPEEDCSASQSSQAQP